jgi:Fuc2NAc and GlcNAc transferase
MTWTVGLWVCGTSALAWALTSRIRRFALGRSMLDVPNHRSSHSVPTPRGGGLAIVVATLAAWGLMPAMGFGTAVPTSVVAAVAGVAAVGFIDDLQSVPAGWRLMAHLLAAGGIVSALGGLPVMYLGSFDMSVAPLGSVLAVLLVAWWINLTNFMDGIDGIAGAHVVAVCLGGAWLNAVVGTPLHHVFGPVALAAATIGFLAWNWPPARIFMGDVGSGFVGAMIAVFTLSAGHHRAELGWAWIILAGAFVVDATVTLGTRVARRDRLAEAHRSHAYQVLAARWGRHRGVSLLWTGMTLLWLLPCAYVVAVGGVAGWAGLLIAYLPLVLGLTWVQRMAASHSAKSNDVMLG